jgi:hypothetical protein
MTLPSVEISRADGQTGVVKPSPAGVLCIIAPSASGTANQPQTYTKAANVLADFGHGPLAEFAAYVMSVARKPVLCIKCDATTVGAYGALTEVGEGTSAITADSTEPCDDYEVFIEFVTGGTIGVAGITYRYSLDGGKTMSGITALGTGSTLTIPNSGVGFDFAAGTVLADQTLACTTTAPAPNNTNLSDALEALRLSSQPWEALLVSGASTATTVSTLDTWLSALEATGKHRVGFINSRFRNSGETEAQYITAMDTAFNAAASLRVCVASGSGDVVSPLRGVTHKRAVALGLAARCMAVDIATDPAFVADGPIAGYQIKDDRGNPKYHDEALYPGLDDLRLASLRSFEGRNGAYITNAPMISSAGSDYVFIQHARVMNRACDLAWQTLSGRLSDGVMKNPSAEANGEVYIREEEAADIEGLVQTALERELVTPRRVSGAAFTLSRTDDLSSNQGAELNGEVAIQALAYVKKFSVEAKFVKAITVAAT